VDDDRVGAIAERRNAFFKLARVAYGRDDSARVGNEQRLGVHSIRDGSAFIFMFDQKERLALAAPWGSDNQSRLGSSSLASAARGKAPLAQLQPFLLPWLAAGVPAGLALVNDHPVARLLDAGIKKASKPD
jgi:hypothetical protein